MGLLLAALALAACKEPSEASIEVPEPYTVEPIEGTDQVAVVLTEDGMQRIGLKTTTSDGSTVPESAIWIDTEGLEWVYTSPESGRFVREQVVVDRYEDRVATLAEGLSPGMQVVTVGVAELIGSEFGI